MWLDVLCLCRTIANRIFGLLFFCNGVTSTMQSHISFRVSLRVRCLGIRVGSGLQPIYTYNLFILAKYLYYNITNLYQEHIAYTITQYYIIITTYFNTFKTNHSLILIFFLILTNKLRIFFTNIFPSNLFQS